MARKSNNNLIVGLDIGTSKVLAIVGEISMASDEQAMGIDQINQALIDMDSVTQQNAVLVEQAAATSKSMSDKASELTARIAKFSVSEEVVDPASDELIVERRSANRPWADQAKVDSEADTDSNAKANSWR